MRQVGDTKILVRRAFEVINAIQALGRAYDNYFAAVNYYNRAEFQLYHALGYPAANLQGVPGMDGQPSTECNIKVPSVP